MDGDNPLVREKYPLIPQGISADLIATVEGFSRTDVDELAVASQERAAKAIAEGRFDKSVIPVINADGSVALDHEEFPRPGTTLEALASWPRASPRWAPHRFDKFDGRRSTRCACAHYPQIDAVEHVHHAGNSSGVVDGASAILVASSDYAKANGLTPRARIRMTAAVGAEPVIMLTGPAPGAQRCLAEGRHDGRRHRPVGDQRGVRRRRPQGDPRARHRPDKVNVNGGAIALGHPIGATGAMLIQTALDELERTDKGDRR